MTTERRRPSIRSRLLLTALLVFVLLLPAAGGVLAWSFRESATSAFDERLESLLLVVIAGLESDPQTGQIRARQALGDPRFERPHSGWYWQVTRGASPVLTSPSLQDGRLAVVDGHRERLVRDIPGPESQRLRSMEQDLLLPGQTQPLHVSVAVDRTEIDVEVQHFSRLLWTAIGVLGLILLLALTLQLQLGLQPLVRLRQHLQEIREGRRQRLPEDLPSDLAGIAIMMNRVLEHDQQMIQRGRSAAGNLAHALKTPLSVLKMQATQLSLSQQATLQRELDRIDDAIRHHLTRATTAGGTPFARRVSVGDALKPVIEAMEKLCQRRQIRLTTPGIIPGDVAIDPQDLQEIVGNLLENAQQWARSRIELKVLQESHGVVLLIDDDGPGLAPEQMTLALQRGVRLDERQPGSGLGLNIVDELVMEYGGRLELATAGLGGLRARVWLPETSPSR